MFNSRLFTCGIIQSIRTVCVFNTPWFFRSATKRYNFDDAVKWRVWHSFKKESFDSYFWRMVHDTVLNWKVKLMINKVQPRKLLETQSWTNVCAMNKSLRYFILIWIFELQPVSFCKLLLWIISAFSSTFIHSVTVMNANKSCIIHCINNYRDRMSSILS